MPLDPGAPAASALLQPGGAQRGDPPAARRAQRASVPAPAGLPAQCLRGARSAGDAAPAGDAVRVSPSGRSAPSPSTTTSMSIAITTACRTRSWATRCGRATRRPPWRCFFRSERVASHVRSYQRGAHTTLPEHMPKSHRAHAEWSPKRLIQWGESIGAHTGAVVEHLLRSKPHPEQGYRACLGLLALARAVRRGAAGGRQRARRAPRQSHPQERQVDPRERPGSAPPSSTEPLALELPAARQRARPGLLPLTIPHHGEQRPC